MTQEIPLYSRHHIFFPRNEWSRSPINKLRNQESLMPFLTREEHDALHENSLWIPQLGVTTVRLALHDFCPDPGCDFQKNLQNIMISIEKSRHKETSRFLSESAEEAVYILSMQLPYLKEALNRRAASKKNKLATAIEPYYVGQEDDEYIDLSATS